MPAIESRVSENLLGRFVQWLVFALFVGVGFGWFAGGKEVALANRLATEGVHVQGVVTETSAGDALNAPTVHYTYMLQGRERYGYSHVDSGKVLRLEPGATIDVVVLPDDPSSTGTDLEAMRNAGKSGIFITAIIELVVALFFWGPVLFSVLAIGKLNFPVGNFLAGIAITGLMFLGGAAALFLSAVPQLQRAEGLAAGSAVVQAQITGVYDGDNGRYANYSYSVDGNHYSGSADYSGGYGDRGTLSVHYLPSEPGYSSLFPVKEVANAKQGVVFLAIWCLIALGFTVAIYIAGRRTL